MPEITRIKVLGKRTFGIYLLGLVIYFSVRILSLWIYASSVSISGGEPEVGPIARGILAALNFLDLIIAGVVVGYLSRKNGIKTGFSFGVAFLIFLIFLAAVLAAVFKLWPHVFFGDTSDQFVNQQVIRILSSQKPSLHWAVVLGQAAIGGFLGEKLYRWKTKS